ncbi:hypothetical protein [Neobacillus vireti]|nr:hypothetical protein [Neobacillus vireti]
MKSDDEDGIKEMLQRAGGCCEPVQFLKEKRKRPFSDVWTGAVRPR